MMAPAALAVPAGAAPPPPAGHTLISFPQRDFVSDMGFSQSDGPVIVNVIRSGVTIATSAPVEPRDDPKTGGFDGIVEVNHPGGGCWVTSTPDILPGDTIRMTARAGAGFSEDTTTANVTAQPADQVGNDIVVHGTAQDATGQPLPLAQIEQRMVAGGDLFIRSNKRTLRAGVGTTDGTLTYDPVSPANPAGINWTAIYSGLDPADITRALGAETRGLWLGADPALLNEATIYETASDGSIVAGPATPCTAPLARSAIGALEINGAATALINQDNRGGDLVISGPYDPVNVNGVTVTIPGATVPAAALTAGTWTVTLPAAALPEGAVKVTATFTATPVTPATPTTPASGGGGAPNSTMTIVKDTVAPGAPTANLAGGTYTGPQTIMLQGDPGATVRFTGDGSMPTATSGVQFTAPFGVTSSQTINAVAVDNHGNVGAPSTFAYTIGGAPGASPGALVPLLPSQQIRGNSASSLAVSRLTLARRISITRLGEQGLRATMRLQEGTSVVRIAIYKARGSHRTGGALLVTTRTPTKSGLYRVTLRSKKLRAGSYVMEVRAGRSAATLGSGRRVAFTVTK